MASDPLARPIVAAILTCPFCRKLVRLPENQPRPVTSRESTVVVCPHCEKLIYAESRGLRTPSPADARDRHARRRLFRVRLLELWRNLTGRRSR